VTALPQYRVRTPPLGIAAAEPPRSGEVTGGHATQLEHNLIAALNVRAHAFRATARVAALLVVDVGAFALLRAGVRLLRSGTGAAAPALVELRALLHAGYLGGWQFATALLLGLVVTGSYGSGDRRRESHRIIGACALAALLPLWSTLWAAPGEGAAQLALTVTLVAAALLAARGALDAILCRYAPHPQPRTILVGTQANCLDVWRQDSESRAFDLLGYVGWDVDPHPAATMRRLIVDARADTVMLCGQVDDATYAAVVRTAAMGECSIVMTTRRLDTPGLQPEIVWRRGRPLVELRRMGLRGHQLLVKRAADVVLASVALVCLAPVTLAVALAVRLTSPGPAVYGQRRLGRHGRSFRCYKFRSMYADAEARLKSDPALFAEYVASDYKLPDGRDPRITPVGRTLRRTSLDELPQLWNVLRGDMSLVGPRPIVPDEIRHYKHDGQLLLLLKPGMTGSWQVSGRSSLPYPARTSVELDYVQRWNLGRDLAILLRTVPAVLTRRGAH
jgi:exopolysaccharide biosynthesis polyprenyl glycosylphosphotransferase